MTYALVPPLVTGKTPAYFWTDDPNYALQPGEVFVSREDFNAAIESPYGAGVWSGTTLRRRTDAEKLEIAKSGKGVEIVLDFNEAVKELYPVALHTDYAWHVELMYAIATNNTVQRTSLQNLVQKRRRAEQALSQADTSEKVEAITFGAA